MVESHNLRTRLPAKLMLGLLYAVFFSAVFVTALYWTFPYDRLRDFIASKLSSTGADATTVEIGELAPVGLSGVRVRDLSVVRAIPPDPTNAIAANVAGPPPSELRLSEVTAQLALLPLLLGNQHLALDALVGKGKLTGTLERNGDAKQIALTFTALDVGALGLASFISLPLDGLASGSIDLQIPVDPTKTTGKINLEIRGVRVGDGKTKVKPPGMAAGFTLDEIDAGKLKLALDVRDGVAKLTQCSADGNDLKLTGKGQVRLADPWKRSRPELDVELNFTPAYKNKSDRTKAMFELLNMQPDWQRATSADGTLRLHIGGTFLAIRGTPGH